jgi:hypothetical protein
MSGFIFGLMRYASVVLARAADRRMNSPGWNGTSIAEVLPAPGAGIRRLSCIGTGSGIAIVPRSVLRSAQAKHGMYNGTASHPSPERAGCDAVRIAQEKKR